MCIKRIFNVLFWVIGICMCYLTTIIFCSKPHLIDSLGKPKGDNAQIQLLSIMCIPVLSIFSFAKNPLLLCATINRSETNENYLNDRLCAICTLIMYFFTIIWSNIITLLIFKYVTATLLLIILIIPMGLTLSGLTLAIFKLFKQIFEKLQTCCKDILEDKKNYICSVQI